MHVVKGMVGCLGDMKAAMIRLHEETKSYKICSSDSNTKDRGGMWRHCGA